MARRRPFRDTIPEPLTQPADYHGPCGTTRDMGLDAQERLLGRTPDPLPYRPSRRALRPPRR